MQKIENVFKEKVCDLFWYFSSANHSPIKIIKHNDMTNIGISDLQIIRLPKSVFVEVKYVEGRLPKRGKILKHHFTAKQISFLQQVSLIGHIGIGIIGIEETNEMYVIPAELLEQNLTLTELLQYKKMNYKTMDTACVFLDYIYNL